MQKKKYRKVNFRISHCSSQDPEYPVTQLLLQSPDAKGWQSKRFSTYPQIIIIQLVEPTLLRQISFLSHQSKIASKIQIQAKLNEAQNWKKLGYVSLTSNQNTNFQARQLRTANINGLPVYMLKLTLRANHVNSQNIFNQVGLISLSVYGDKMVQSNFTSTSVSGQNKPINTTLEFDKQTLNKLKQLEIRKKEAVENEQFDLAKNIKEQIQRIKNIGQTLILLEQKKQQAIKKEDYETAKIINDQMKKMRDDNNWGPNISNKPSGNPAQFYKKQKVQLIQEEEKTAVSPISTQSKYQERQLPKRQPNRQVQQRPIQAIKPSYTKERPLDIDQRPLDNKGKKLPPEFQQEPQNEGGDLEPLNKEIQAQCQPYFGVIDEQIFCHLFSKDHKNRENGMKMLRGKLNERPQDKQTFIEGVLYTIKCTIDDRIASVLVATLETFDEFMRKIKPQANSNNLTYAEYILEKIADYLGHNNQKIRIVSETIYSNLPVYHLTNKDVCYKALTMIYKRDKPAKILTGKLKMISKIVAQYQLGKNYEDVITYCIKYVDDKNNDVRSAAITALCSVANQVGYPAVQPFLKNVRPPIIKTIQEQLESVQGGGGNFNNQQKPIKAKGSYEIPSKTSQKTSGRQNQISSVQNEFIEMPKKKNNQNQDFQCPFCKKFDERFAQEDYLDMHFFHSCPMLTICVQCKQTIEISYLTAHLVGECQNSKYFKKCPRCKEAVQQKNYKAHVEKKQCLSAKPPAQANRCPLCHLDISPGVDGWREHLVEEGCQNNPRK